MIIIHKIKMDLVHHGVMPRVDAVQGDINSRVLQLSLYASGVAWDIPDDATVSMRYSKPDGTKGIYDTLPDGNTAWSIDGNVISMTLAPQMLTAAGSVFAQIVMIRNSDLLATFTLQVNVARDPSAGTLKSEDYVNWLHACLKNEINEVFQAAKEAGELTGPSGPQGPQGLIGETGPRGPSGAPYNWLDNSDFRQPVNEYGGTFYHHMSGGIGIDRWTLMTEQSTMEVTENGVMCTGTFAQYLSEEAKTHLYGRTVTVAILDAYGSLYLASGSFNDGFSAVSESITISLTSEMISITTNFGGLTYPVISLYEGEYTDETLPNYQYKGYAAELMECRRYYIAPDAVSLNVEILPDGEKATASVSGTVEKMNIALEIPNGEKEYTPKPLFVVSGSYNGDYYWMHQYGDGEPATVEEMVDAFFGGGICRTEDTSTTRSMTKISGVFFISNDTVAYSNLKIYGGTEAQYLDALSKYLPEE